MSKSEIIAKYAQELGIPLITIKPSPTTNMDALPDLTVIDEASYFPNKEPNP